MKDSYMPSVMKPAAASMGNKAAPRAGAAKGCGAGMGGYNGSTVKKAMSMPGAGSMQYFSGAGQKRK